MPPPAKRGAIDRATANRVTPLRESAPPPLPPANVEAEQALLGAIFINNGAYSRVNDRLYQEHFANAVHGRIYAAIGRLIDEGAPANPVTLKNLFDQDGALAEIGGAAYLARLAESAVTIINASYYADTIIDAYRRRLLITLGEDVITRAYTYVGDDPVEKQIEESGSRLFDLSEIGGTGLDRPRVMSGGDAAAAALDTAQRAYREPGKLAGISSGVVALDKWVGGFAPGDLYIVGGRPGQGKSSLMNSFAWAACEAGHAPLIFSGEMTAPQLMARLMAALSEVSAGRQRRGDLLPSDWERLNEAQQKIAQWPLVIDDGAMTLPRIRQQTRFKKRRNKTDLVMIDYLQLVNSGTETDSRLADVGRVSNGLKRMAKDLDIPIVALAQLSRAVEAREDKRPMMSDLRYAGEIEQDADAIMLLYRHEYYLSKAEPRQNPSEPDLKFQERHAQWSNALHEAKGRAEILVVKNRHDREGVAHVMFDAERSFFHDPTEAQRGLF